MAFRTRCPSCGTLFSAPDDMLHREIKCPRCRDTFTAAEEPVVRDAPPPPPQQEQPLPSEMAPAVVVPEGGQTIHRYCQVCNTAFTEDDILDGLAVRRFDDVYCRKHFRERFPDECEQHPGTKAVTECGRCGQPVCQNCVVELQGERICSRCKRLVLGELRGDYAPGAAFSFGERPGLPWDTDEGGFFQRLFGTIKEVLFSPGRAFQKMRIRGGFGRPLLFTLLMSVFAIVLSVLWQFLILGGMAMQFPGARGNEAEMAGFMAGSLVMAVVFYTIFALVLPFVWAAILHVSLLILKGANNGFECTYRVVAYSGWLFPIVGGATAIFTVIPFAGQYIGFIWAIVAAIFGLSRGHNISGGRAALAFFIPLIICCGAFVGLIALVFASLPMPGQY